MRRLVAPALAAALLLPSPAYAQRYTGADGKLRISLAQQPFSPNGTSVGPRTMAQGGIQQILSSLGATIRVQEATLTADENTEFMAHQNKVPGGPSSEELAALFEKIFSRYPKASAIGFATIPATDEGGLALAAVNRMIAAAVRGVKTREARTP